MALKKIKLAGFKSFVDPTTIPFTSNRTAVVGPNGCGKSNIIDAIRWVMGESSAKQLRGESMADVIFNGTTTRKPVGQASIELIFDNTKGLITGEYASYNEIAIRREVNREGLSNYYLNNSRCRRKDIIDIFLGTGLGPHSYSVIEQGMISQLIEAKPEELRGFLEEAAGISKYKERRRETENRIRHTKENLERLNDIREELERQLRHLKRQANAANRYKILKQEQRELRAQLQALHWRAVNEQLIEQESALKNKELELEANITEQGSISSAMEKLRTEQEEAADVYNEVQGRYYRLGAEVGRIEQQIQHSKERCQQLEQDLQQLTRSTQETENHIRNDKETIQQLTTELQELEPRELTIKAEEQGAKQKLILAEETVNEWQIAWDTFNSNAAQNSKLAEVEQTRLEHLRQKITHERELLTKLKTELDNLDIHKLEGEIAGIEQRCVATKQQSETAKSQLAEQRTLITAQRESNNQLTNNLNNSRQELQQLQGRYVSLQALQQAALGKTNNTVNNWLSVNKLAGKPRLAQQIKVEAGWERALETVLSSHLEAVCVDNLESVAGILNSLQDGALTLFAAEGEQGSVKANTLASKVTTSLPIIEQLNRMIIADGVAEALQLRKRLSSEESVITREGIWFGGNWVRVNFAKDDKHGVLKREQELTELKNRVSKQEQLVTEEERALNQGRRELEKLEQAAIELQEQYNSELGAYSDIYGELNIKKTDLQYLQQRKITLAQEITTHEQNISTADQQLETIKEIWQQAEEQKLSHDKKREHLLEQREQYRTNLEREREAAMAAQEQAAQLVMRLEFIRNKIQYLTQNLERAKAQITALNERKLTLAQTLSATQSPLAALDSELADALQKRLAVETELTTAKSKVDEIAHGIREKEAERVAAENRAQAIHSALEQLKMEWKALQVRCNTYEEQITEANFNLETLLAEMPEEAELTVWEEKTENISKKIDRLGPINLAAITEYEQSSERKQYLDAQNDDLVEALATLEDAMRKIDRDTKNRFKNAFEAVNGEFMRLFPIVFGGGKASLELTGDDMLDAGAYIVAQPPGKKNSTIHLLSGGEKALTAIALVFAIFQLNPAPFCMLDEVDAPLDDNNVVRFCNLVREMSNTVQFIFISHNKITMEMAEQLTGVTMHEPGVSRIVSVDIAEAINMAEQGKATGA